MGLTLVIKRKFFNIYICSFSTIFYAISISDTYGNLFPNQISIKYLNPRARWTTSGLVKRTAAILDFHFRFLFWRMCSHRRIILHLSSKFRRDRKIGGGVMTSYRFLKMAAYSRKCTSGFRFSDWRDLFKKVEIYLRAKQRWYTSIHGWDKTTSGFGKRTAAILEFYFRFRFWRMCSHWHVILHLSAKFRSNQSIVGRVMTLYLFFQDGRRQAYWIWSR